MTRRTLGPDGVWREKPGEITGVWVDECVQIPADTWRKLMLDAVTLGDAGILASYDRATHSLKITPIDRAARLAASQEDHMGLHPSTYEYLKPTDAQLEQMAKVRAAAKAYNDVLDAVLPDGPDKTFVIRAHRSNAMWANVAITRLPDGTPRIDAPQEGMIGSGGITGVTG